VDQLTATPLAHIVEAPIRWLWKPFLPRGKIALLDGDPGLGKSLLTLDLAARLSRGVSLPDGQPAGGPHKILLLAAEDDPACTIRPRAAAAGADLERLIVVADWEGLPIQFPEHLQQLGVLVRRHRPDLIVIDPVMAFLSPRIGAQNDQCVRQLLNVLAGSANRTDCAVLLVRHLRKAGSRKALYRGSGSIGFIAAARTGLLAAPHPRDRDRNVLAITKSNLADIPPALIWRIRPNADGQPVVEWQGEADVEADELNVAQDVRPRGRAIAWLRDQLASGPRKSADLLKAAAAAGIPKRTLLRTKSDLGVLSHRLFEKGKQGVSAWWWYDPAVSWPNAAPFKQPVDLTLPPEGL
jgi:putative DNA primase/helicase